MKPRYLHDCSRCKFLGAYNEYDLYFCPQTVNIPTVIARYGHDDPEYTSGLNSTLEPLRVAKDLAVHAGYIHRD